MYNVSVLGTLRSRSLVLPEPTLTAARAGALGLLFPGAGLIAVGKIPATLAFLVTLIGVPVTLFVWFAMGGVLFPLLLWFGSLFLQLPWPATF